MLRTTFPPDVETVPGTVPPETEAETSVEFVGAAKVIVWFLMWFTVMPETVVGTVEALGARVMATAEPDAAVLGAVVVIDAARVVVAMPAARQFQFTLTVAALAGAAKQKTEATATGMRTPARSRDEVDLMAISRKC